MSYCQIIEFRNNKPDTAYEFRNAWGGHARIWNSLYERYCKDPNREYDSWMGENSKKLWALQHRTDLAMFVRAVLEASFDYAIVRQENYAQFANHLREFVKEFPLPSDTYDHLPRWADTIEKSQSEAIAFHATSVCSNPWHEYNGETDESTLYDLSTGTKHFEIYDCLLKRDN